MKTELTLTAAGIAARQFVIFTGGDTPTEQPTAPAHSTAWMDGYLAFADNCLTHGRTQ